MEKLKGVARHLAHMSFADADSYCFCFVYFKKLKKTSVMVHQVKELFVLSHLQQSTCMLVGIGVLMWQSMLFGLHWKVLDIKSFQLAYLVISRLLCRRYNSSH